MRDLGRSFTRPWGPYVPGVAGRDERIDLLRGLAVVAMVVDHLAGPSVLYALTGGNRFYTSAAEAFILISGLVMGLVYRKLTERLGLAGSLQRAMERAATLYLVTVTLTLLFLPISELLQMEWAQRVDLRDPLGLVISVLTLHRTYYLVDIPLLYTLLLLVSPLALVLLAQRRTGLMLAASWVLWAVFQVFPGQAAAPWGIEGNHLFFFSAWQVFFFTGLALGWHHAELTERLARFPRRAALVASSVGFAALIALYAFSERLPEIFASDVERAAGVQLFLLEAVFSKADVRVGRILATVIVLGFLYLLVTEAWRPIRAGLGWLLLPLGQNALYAYVGHVVLAVPVKLIAGALASSGGPPEAVNALAEVVGLIVIWLAIRGRVLFVDPARGPARYMWPATAIALCLFTLSIHASLALPPVAMAAAPDTDPRAARIARAFGTPIPGRPVLTPAPGGAAAVAPTRGANEAASDATPAEALSDLVGPIQGTVEVSELYSPALDRVMPYMVYLPPGYERSGRRYSVLYMLHGNSGHYEEWAAYGLIGRADEMIVSGEIQPLIIVLPQGDYSYWVNLVDGGPAYGDYLALDVVRHVGRTYRVLSGAENRAIGGLSMGGTGALVGAFVRPNVFSVVGAHSPSLPEEGARPFLGSGADFARRAPIALAESEPWLEELSIWIDMGNEDPWLARGQLLHTALEQRCVAHEWHELAGDHWGGYWEENIPAYLRFYDSALNSRKR